MSMFSDPYDAETNLEPRCACRRHADTGVCPGGNAQDNDTLAAQAADAAVMCALFPRDALRRRFLKAVGGTTALAAVAQLFPLGAARDALAQGAGKVE